MYVWVVDFWKWLDILLEGNSPMWVFCVDVSTLLPNRATLSVALFPILFVFFLPRKVCKGMGNVNCFIHMARGAYGLEYAIGM